MNGAWPSSMEEVLLLASIGVCGFFALVFLFSALSARNSERFDQRLQEIAGSGDETAETPALLDRIDLEREESVPAGPEKWTRAIPLGKVGDRKLGLHRRFIRAGIDPVRGKKLFLLARITFFLGGCLVAAYLFGGFFPLTDNVVLLALVIVAAGIGCSFLPVLLLSYHIRERQRRIERTMPDMIDLLILCVEAGLTLEVALARAVEGLEPFAPEVAAEMKITLSELRILPDKSMALTNLEERTASRSLKYLVLSLRQSEHYGTSITGALKAVATENRKHAMLELENNAARMPALLSIPLILFILPPVVALSAGPGFALMMRAIGG
ncbi:type II secretion system F family protein [uncultured Sneathiella sp.]|uniref:type II secretion system F family protein n=1 Tax=uncultured Sneathiella sp. TaxID=879315 RepID=UPI0025960988|nr:type II secretion system F family protein [uncultured Sneathiella sp.]